MPKTLKEAFTAMTGIIETATAAMEDLTDLTEIVQLGHDAFVNSFKVKHPGVEKLRELVEKKTNYAAYFVKSNATKHNRSTIRDAVETLCAKISAILTGTMDDDKNDRKFILTASEESKWPVQEAKTCSEVLGEMPTLM